MSAFYPTPRSVSKQVTLLKEFCLSVFITHHKQQEMGDTSLLQVLKAIHKYGVKNKHRTYIALGRSIEEPC